MGSTRMLSSLFSCSWMPCPCCAEENPPSPTPLLVGDDPIGRTGTLRTHRAPTSLTVCHSSNVNRTATRLSKVMFRTRTVPSNDSMGVVESEDDEVGVGVEVEVELGEGAEEKRSSSEASETKPVLE